MLQDRTIMESQWARSAKIKLSSCPLDVPPSSLFLKVLQIIGPAVSAIVFLLIDRSCHFLF